MPQFFLEPFGAPSESLGIGKLSSKIEHPHSLLQGFLETRPDRHDLPDRPHLSPDLVTSVDEFLEIPARHLHNDIVKARLEAGSRDTSDSIRQLGKRVAEREFGREVSYRITCGLR